MYPYLFTCICPRQGVSTCPYSWNGTEQTACKSLFSEKTNMASITVHLTLKTITSLCSPVSVPTLFSQTSIELFMIRPHFIRSTVCFAVLRNAYVLRDRNNSVAFRHLFRSPLSSATR